MKKLLLYCVVMLPFMVLAQISINNNWKNSINPIFSNLDKSRVESGILLDYAMEFTDVTAYNGTLTDSTTIDRNSSDTY